MSKLHAMIGAAALALAAGTAAIAATPAEAPQARQFNAIAVGNQVALDSAGKRHDPARFGRLLTLLQSPQLTVLNVERWMEARRGGGGGAGTSMPQLPFQPRMQNAPNGSALAPLAAMPGMMVTPAADVIGEDKAAREAFKETLIANRAYVLDMRNRLLGTQSLRDAGVPIDQVIAVDVMPGSGSLEVFTVPVR